VKKLLIEHWTILSIIGWAVVIAALFTGLLLMISSQNRRSDRRSMKAEYLRSELGIMRRERARFLIQAVS
jgi:hypothetical protein